MIDLYCERTGPEFWSEPVNALTNASFIFGALLAYRDAKKRFVKIPSDIFILIILLFSIGVGSFLFHTFATRWAILTDIIPIILYELAFIWIYSRKIIRLKTTWTIVLLVLFLALSAFLTRFPAVFNGSLPYFPSILFLAGFGIYHYRKNKNEKYLMFLAGILFILSLFFRIIDNSLCGCFPLGTHFMWHILNGTLLYLTLRAVVVNYDNGK